MDKSPSGGLLLNWEDFVFRYCEFRRTNQEVDVGDSGWKVIGVADTRVTRCRLICIRSNAKIVAGSKCRGRRVKREMLPHRP